MPGPVACPPAQRMPHCSCLCVRSAFQQVAEEEAAREVVASCTGNWLSHLDWDGER